MQLLRGLGVAVLSLFLSGAPLAAVADATADSPGFTKASLSWSVRDNSGEPAQGTAFVVKDPRGEINYLSDCIAKNEQECQFTLDKDIRAGFFKITDLKAEGNYLVTQALAAPSHRIDEKPKTIKVTAGRNRAVEMDIRIPDPFLSTKLVSGNYVPEFSEFSWKVADRAGKPVPHAKFKYLRPGGITTEIGDCVANEASLCTGEDKDPRVGYFHVTDLSIGLHVLTQISSENGYSIEGKDRFYRIFERNKQIKKVLDLGVIENDKVRTTNPSPKPTPEPTRDPRRPKRTPGPTPTSEPSPDPTTGATPDPTPEPIRIPENEETPLPGVPSPTLDPLPPKTSVSNPDLLVSAGEAFTHENGHDSKLLSPQKKSPTSAAGKKFLPRSDATVPASSHLPPMQEKQPSSSEHLVVIVFGLAVTGAAAAVVLSRVL